MSDFAQKLIVASVAVAVGIGLVLFGLFVAHQMVWVGAGEFFAVIGLAALALTFAPVAPGPLGQLLRSPGFGVLILAAIGASLCFTVTLGILGQ